MNHEDLEVKALGECRVGSPLKNAFEPYSSTYRFVGEEERILYDVSLASYRQCLDGGNLPLSFEKAGPREKIYFDPSKTRAAIVTCGGLCPGLNNVIRSLVNELWYRYGVKKIIGIRYGYEGLNPAFGHPVVEIEPRMTNYIHLIGGTVLGSSRGNQDVPMMVDSLERLNVNILFCIGGDGTLRGAHAIAGEIAARNVKIAVGGIPKTIDNDIDMIQKSFGFETAFSVANDIIRNAHNEAAGAYNGIAIVKVMGRESGFIAANAALSIQEVNFVLVPEIGFDLDGPHGFISALRKRLEKRHHAVIVVAEGAGQDLFVGGEQARDASGNLLNRDIGILLRDSISENFRKEGFPHSIKYIDPSYIIRSVPANPNDSKFCSLLAQNAVHGAMAGKTDFVLGYWNDSFTHLPIPVAVAKRKKIDTRGELWWHVLEATGQPPFMKNN